jgi:hypothetical protein
VRAAIFCEGKSDRDFLEALIKHLGFNSKEVSFYVLRSKSDFFKHNDRRYRDVRMEIDGGTIDKLLFMIDADYAEKDVRYGGCENTKNALENVIKTLGFEAISSVYIMCDPDSKTGYLESLILSTLPEAQRGCIARFLECSQFKDKEDHKAIINQIYNTAYPDRPYNFGHPHFGVLIAELKKLWPNTAAS